MILIDGIQMLAHNGHHEALRHLPDDKSAVRYAEPIL
jgi:hypothetical protein